MVHLPTPAPTPQQSPTPTATGARPPPTATPRIRAGRIFTLGPAAVSLRVPPGWEAIQEGTTLVQGTGPDRSTFLRLLVFQDPGYARSGTRGYPWDVERFARDVKVVLAGSLSRLAILSEQAGTVTTTGGNAIPAHLIEVSYDDPRADAAPRRALWLITIAPSGYLVFLEAGASADSYEASKPSLDAIILGLNVGD